MFLFHNYNFTFICSILHSIVAVYKYNFTFNNRKRTIENKI